MAAKLQPKKKSSKNWRLTLQNSQRVSYIHIFILFFRIWQVTVLVCLCILRKFIFFVPLLNFDFAFKSFFCGDADAG